MIFPILGDLALHKSRNLIHGSDSVESAKREIDLWFPDSARELLVYSKHMIDSGSWLVDPRR